MKALFLIFKILPFIIREEFNESKILVISGVGVREYFRKLGYERDSYYMGKKIA